jgi:heat shock protein HslJ
MKKILFILVSITLIFSSCNFLNDSDDLNFDNKLFEGKWTLIEINGISNAVITNEVTIKFQKDENTIVGDNSCNNYCGEYKLDDNKLIIKSLISTKIACINDNIEDEYMITLLEVNYYLIDNDILFLKDKNGKILTKFKHIQ